jgi:hypothetical protein
VTLSVDSALPRSDRLLLRIIGYIVPLSDRDDWLRSWEAELWWRRYPPCREARHELFTDLSIGLCLDAFWLRLENWGRVLRGTATLCLLVLGTSCFLSVLLAICLYGNWYVAKSQFLPQLGHFLFASPLIVFVTSATAHKRPDLSRIEQSLRTRLYRIAFLGAKLASLLLLMYLLSLDMCSAIAFSFPNACEYVQMLLFVIGSICGLRWAFQDQARRCKACLRLLNEPQRVGRPSHNLIEQSGNESVCRKGHGFLSVPELETSWRQSSEWISGVIM